MYKIGAVLTGVIISIMISLNGILAQHIGNYLSVLVIHGLGALGILCFLLISRKKIIINKNIPLYLFFAGALGVLVIISNNLCFKYLGMTLTVSLGLLGQSICACIVDHFGFMGMSVHKFEKEKLVGYGIVFMGIIVMTIF